MSKVFSNLSGTGRPNFQLYKISFRQYSTIVLVQNNGNRLPKKVDSACLYLTQLCFESTCEKFTVK